MRFANPAGLWLGLLAIPIVVLHILRPRRPPVEVSSTFLWRAVARPVSVAAPWQRLRPSALLAAQLLAVALLAGAVAQPVRPTAARLAEHTVFILDASGSMAATDGRPDRLAEAKDKARDLRRQLPGGGVASVVVAGFQARVVLSASPDPDAFDAAIAAVRTTAGPADFATAFNLAESVETPGTPVGFVLLSDGGLTEEEQTLLPPGTDYRRTGSRSTNRAVNRLTVEPRGSGLHARVSLRNTGGPAATQTLRLDVDGRTAHTEQVELGAGAALEREIDLPGGDRVEAFLEGEDLLAADDHAFATARRRRPLKVLLTGPGNVFLERLFASLPSVTVERSEEARPAPGFDLVVYDGVAVPADPGAPFLAIAPPGGATTAGVVVTGEVENPAVTLVRSDDALLAGLDVSEVGIAKAQRLSAPAADVLVGAEGAPLLLRGALGGRPFAYLAFPLAQSNLPLQVAFPLLGDRLLTELAGAALPPADLRVGQPLPVSLAGAATVDAPAGVQLTLAAGGAAPVTDRAGFWTVHQEGRPDVTFAVNADPAESTIAPAAGLPVPERARGPGERRATGERPWLKWVVFALLLTLAVELFLSQRRKGVSRRQWRAAVILRMAIAALLVGALAGLAIPRTSKRVAVMFLVDASDSLGVGGQVAAVDWVREALRHQPDGALAGVAFFGGDARLELTVQSDATLLQPATKVDASRTNLAGALRLAGAVLPADARRRIVVVSDGRATEGDAATEARRLREDGIRVDVHPVEVLGGADMAVARVDAPSHVKQGEAFTVRATISSSTAQTIALRWTRDGETVEERVIDVAAGQTIVELPQTAGDSSAPLSSYRLQISGPADARLENDVGFAAVQVEGPARILLVEGMTGNGATLATALRAGGLPVDVVGAGELPPVDQLATYSSTVLVDVDARSLSGDQVASLTVATRDLGRGLVVIGGDRSFALGGYLDSELEKLLPVISDIKDPTRRPSVAEVLAIDSSGSMGACHCSEGGANGLMGGNRDGGGVNKTDISRAAAARTISALAAEDHVGVLAFNTEQKWIVPLQQLPAEDVVTKGLRQLSPAGGTDLSKPLLAAGEALRNDKAKLKHIILFTDGFTSEGGLDALVDQAKALADEGITVSVLATGETGADANLAAVAEAGRGRFYNETDLTQVPQIMMQEAILASRQIVNEGEVFPRVVSSAAPVRDLKAAPPLLGYLGATAKPTAQTHLEVGEEGDPLLASWQVGLGRATAWTSDASARWSQAWITWDGYTAFWAGVVKDTFPLGGSAGAGARAELVDGRLRVTAESADGWPDGATALARVAGPDLQGREVALERASGTTFVGEVPATAAGTYAVGVSVTGPGGETLLSATTTAVQSYSAEYAVGAADPDALARVSTLAGGRGPIEPAAAFDGDGLPVGHGRVALAGWMLLAAALLWPVAVALSRVALHGSGVAALRSGRRRLVDEFKSRLPARPGQDRPPRPPRPPKKAAAAPPVPVPPPTIDRLLQRKRGGPAPQADGGDEAAS